jgi:polysaccharide biosynthesis protein PslH
MRFLFVKEYLAWPRSSGHDVHCYYMMQSLARLGHEISLLTTADPAPEAIAGLPLALKRGFGAKGDGKARTWSPTRWQERFRSYWGVSEERIAAVARTAQDCAADVVVVVGLNVLPYLLGVENACRVWYAADEWAWHHISQVRLLRPRTWGEVRTAVLKGFYERAYRSILDRVWVVTEADRRAMRWVAGVKAIDVLPNGVDAERYRPLEEPQRPNSCVFWGRLDFGPNIQALQWFCDRIWPEVRRTVPDAQFTIYGFNASEAVRALACRDGVTLVPDLPDLREEIARHQLVVLPFVSGGGIKNKLLEAAGMGKAILGTAKACLGLRLEGATPFVIPRNQREWIQQIPALWSDPVRRAQLGVEARQWALKKHSWNATAQDAIAGLESRRR